LSVGIAGPPVRRLDLRLPAQASVLTLGSTETGSPAEGESLEAVSVVVSPTFPVTEADVPDAATGLDALYWAARHPAAAWRVLLPVVPTDEAGSRSERETVCIPLAAPTGESGECASRGPDR